MSDAAIDEGATPTVVKVCPRLIPGILNPGNKDALDWGSHGLVAYGSQSNIVVLDSRGVSTVQSLQGGGKHDVTRIRWSRHLHYHDRARPYTLRLAAADSAGVVTVWNVATGTVKAELAQPGHKNVIDMHWMAYNDASYPLLLVLYESSYLVLWDTERELLVWKKDFIRESGGEKFTGFSVDPFSEASITLLTPEHLWLVEDLTPARAPQAPLRRVDVNLPHVPGGTGSQAQTPTEGPRRSRLLSGVQAMFQGGGGNSSQVNSTSATGVSHNHHIGGGGGGGGGGDATMGEMEWLPGAFGSLVECQAVLHDPAYRDQLLLVFPRHVIVVDLIIQQAIGMAVIERSLAGVFAVRVCRLTGRLVCLHDSGVITVRQRRPFALPQGADDLKGLHCSVSGGSDGSRSVNGTDSTSLPPLAPTWQYQSARSAQFDVHYETLCTSEPYRMVTRNSRIVAFALCPSQQIESDNCDITPLGESMRAAIVLQDGRTLFYRMLPPAKDSRSGKRRLVLSANLETLSTVPHCMKMCPPVTFKNWKTYRPLIACAVGTGNVQVLNVATGAVERNICVHTTAVRGIEWTGLTSFLSFANATLQVTSSQNSNMKNELCLTEVTSGRVRQIRTDRADEKPIELVAVSKHGQYFIVAFKDQPFELWDLRNLSLLSMVSQNFRSITCLEWCTRSALRRKHSETGEETGLATPSKQTEPIFLKSPANDQQDAQVTDNGKTPGKGESQQFMKEHFLAVDAQSKVCFFIVEGSVLKSNMRILVPVSSGSITCTAWKAGKLVLGDSDGNLSLWDITTKKSETAPSLRGAVRRVVFAPGRGNMKIIVLFLDAVELWEATANHTLNRLASLKTARNEVFHVDWTGSVGPLLAWANGTITIMDMELKPHPASAIADYFFEEMPFLPAILSPNSALHLKAILQHLPRGEEVDPAAVMSAARSFLNPEDTALARSMLVDLDHDIWEALAQASVSTRALIIARLFGDDEAVRFWTMFESLVDPVRRRLPPCFDLLLPQKEFRCMQLHRAMLHESKRGSNYQLTQRCVDEFLLLGDADRAVQLLLETESPNPLFTHDALRACLIACLKTENASQSSVVKLVATNLIASGDMLLGVQLLCVINKALDACRYLQSGGQWDKSVWLAKCSLSHVEQCDVVCKWAEHLSLVATNQRSRAALTLLSVGEVGRCVQLLAANQMLERAMLLADAADEAGLQIEWDRIKEEYRPAGLRLKYARYLHSVGNSEAALSFCMKALDMPEAEDLKREIEIILEDSTSLPLLTKARPATTSGDVETSPGSTSSSGTP
ncbi:WD repeat-containing protein 11-like [Tropilaelaps mercedesae]|uniref:WD repeat-containing protein 11-like n=1 Tax=Tropilaelaps mercedesae TaxID=418985 RepID=A0A1V9X116_9ACAR|nr:WD repeat-containing protein 11-like [Tropilaelaps mercedesae]